MQPAFPKTPAWSKPKKVIGVRNGIAIHRGTKRRRAERRSSRVRDLGFLAWLHTQECRVRLLPGHVCEGVMEADHVGDRGRGQKCSDRESISVCTRGHWERQNARGPFERMTREQRRDWRLEQAAEQYATYLSSGSRRTG